MPANDAEKWNAAYRAGGHGNRQACRVLTEHSHLLPSRGAALDLACGMGGNAILLAEHGYETSAWDISSAAITALDDFARVHDLTINTRVVDVVANPPNNDSFDIIVVSRFLQRDLVSHIKKALRADGLIFYQTFTRDRVDDAGPKNPAYLLGDNELLQLFQDLHVLVYHEEGTIGDPARGFRNEAMLVAQKRVTPA